jgi:hypothetical protein
MSGQTFRVGEVAILCNLVKYAYLNGFEVTITTPLREYKTHGGERVVGYRTDLRLPTGWLNADHKFLRKKPPKQSTDEWAESKVKDLLRPVPELEVA